jgi:hypothetical protein
MAEIDRIFNSLKNLKQNKDKTEEELKVLAKEELNRKEILKNLTFCLDDEEKDFASELLNNYLEESSIEDEAEKDSLRQLIDLEILIERIKKFLNTEYTKSNPAIPTQMLQELRDTNEQVLKLKESLGLINKENKQSSWIEVWDTLKKKAINYYETHKGCNLVRCPECQNTFRLMIRTDNLESVKETFFRGTILYNYALYELYHQKKLTKEEMAKIFGVADFFIDFIYTGIYLKENSTI